MNDFSGDESAQNTGWHPGLLFRDTRVSLAFLSRLPVRLEVDEDEPIPLLAECVRGLPLAGLVIGAIAGLAGAAGVVLHLPPLAAAGLAIACGAIITGALHEDGLADVADGFWGGHTLARKLAIMKDSRVGSYGVVALALNFLIKAAAIAGLMPLGPLTLLAAMMAAAALSRTAMVPVMARLSNVRPGGLSAQAGKPDVAAERASVLIGLAAAGLLLLPVAGPTGTVVGLAAATGAAFGMAVLARRHIGGQTGDVCGAVQQLSELALLLALSAALQP